jgi:hypothetical protein
VTLVERHRGEIIYSTRQGALSEGDSLTPRKMTIEASPSPARISQIERGSLLTIFGQLGLNRFLMGRRKGRKRK